MHEWGQAPFMRAFFQEQARRVATLCHLMAKRFARGGRMLALGTTAAEGSDAAHVAVEFVHPVIVGKRALPAVAVSAAHAAAEARRRGLATVALVGYDGGTILVDGIADHVVVARSERIPRIQEARAAAWHAPRRLLEAP